MILYLDSSCLVRLYTGDGPVLPDWGSWEAAFASVLTRVEVRLALRRIHASGAIRRAAFERAWSDIAELEATIEWVPVRDEILVSAWDPAPVTLKALDAIHLATARAIRDSVEAPVVFATHDRRLAAAASEFAFEVAGV